MSDLEKNRVPVNRTAANVLKKGFSEEFICKDNPRFHSKIPPKTCTPPKCCENLIGLKYGRLKVIGYVRTFIKDKITHSHNKFMERMTVKEDGRGGFLISKSHGTPNTPKAHWLVQCICGKYECRTTKAIKNSSPIDACAECLHFKYLTKGI